MYRKEMQSFDWHDIGTKADINGSARPDARETSACSIEALTSTKGMTSMSKDAIVVGIGVGVLMRV